ncbi:hypothetical protein B484DRAFT_76083 [Ochromonadaceae sp. CCMP2298]|nr:hypothetical protein B484DRAFT_76083 [Ochromonadaceae sp. CCMP2298]
MPPTNPPGRCSIRALYAFRRSQGGSRAIQARQSTAEGRRHTSSMDTPSTDTSSIYTASMASPPPPCCSLLLLCCPLLFPGAPCYSLRLPGVGLDNLHLCVTVWLARLVSPRQCEARFSHSSCTRGTRDTLVILLLGWGCGIAGCFHHIYPPMNFCETLYVRVLNGKVHLNPV